MVGDVNVRLAVRIHGQIPTGASVFVPRMDYYMDSMSQTARLTRPRSTPIWTLFDEFGSCTPHSVVSGYLLWPSTRLAHTLGGFLTECVWWPYIDNLAQPSDACTGLAHHNNLGRRNRVYPHMKRIRTLFDETRINWSF